MTGLARILLANLNMLGLTSSHFAVERRQVH